ncbi:MAG TPA: hypothetical protein VNT50_12860 [Microbacterium sp.]|nr:hypothetical protein [Microbacterium sp.]HWI32367.1 hypothetical protein [Microbacterium sp.]
MSATSLAGRLAVPGDDAHPFSNPTRDSITLIAGASGPRAGVT